MILILADGFDICDAIEWAGEVCTSDSIIEKLIYEGSLGAMNTKTASSGPEFCELASACATLGAATRMRASKDDCVFLSAYREHEAKEVDEAFERRTGSSTSILPEEVMVCAGIDELIRHNLTSGYSGKPGFLGESLKRAGVQTRVMMYSDGWNLGESLACLLGMDETGEVAIASHADVGTDNDTFKENTLSKAVEKKFREHVPLDDFKGLTVVEFTDILTALDDETHTPEGKSLADAYVRLDALLSHLFSVIGEPSTTTVYVLASAASIFQLTGRGNELASLLIIGGGFESGLLKSATTRNEGVVANVDFALTITTLLNASQAWRVQGRPMYCVNIERSASALEKKVYLLNFAWKTRGVFLITLITISVLAVITSLILLLTCTGSSERERRKTFKFQGGILKTAHILQVYCAAMPLSALLTPFVLYIFEALSRPAHMTIDVLLPWALSFMLITGALISYFAFRLTGSALKSVLAIALATTAAICADCVFGGQLAQLSPLSYSAISGARYYGVGNEFMGVLLGCVCLCPYALKSIWRTKGWHDVNLLTVELLMGGVFLGVSFLGANFGGMITALSMASFAAMCSGIGFRKADGRRSSGLYQRGGVIVIFAVAVLLAATVILVDSTTFEPSHIGRLLGSKFDGKLVEVLNVVYRKVKMNLSLMNVGMWARITFLSVFIMSAVTFARLNFLKQIRRDEKLYIALLTVAVGCLVAFLLNDSGIVACTTMMILPLFFIISYLFSSEFERS